MRWLSYYFITQIQGVSWYIALHNRDSLVFRCLHKNYWQAFCPPFTKFPLEPGCNAFNKSVKNPATPVVFAQAVSLYECTL